MVSDLPSFAAPPARASLEPPATEPLAVSERAAIEAVVTRFLRAFWPGDASGLEYLVPAGVRIARAGAAATSSSASASLALGGAGGGA